MTKVAHDTEKAERVQSNSPIVHHTSDGSVPKLVLDEKVELAVSLLGIFAVCVATYHVGTTGNWEPLSATAMGLALGVLFVTSER